MNLLIQKATIIDPNSDYNGQTLDVWIKEGTIEAIGKNLDTNGKELIRVDNSYLSIGWLGMSVQTGDPGFEHREDLNSVATAARRGGFTAIACLPNTNPAIQDKSNILYLKNSTKGGIVDFYPIGAVTYECGGQDLTEMLDMSAAGAVAFSDGKKGIQNSGLMMRALQYVKAFDGLIINQPYDANITLEGQMHEGVHSISLGMKGIPNLAEDLMVQRDIFLTEYTNSRLHLSNISSKESVDLIRRAKTKGIDITASVPITNLVFLDEDLLEFDTNFKVFPPLRSKEDQKALKEGLIDGTIDLISTNHVPLEEEVKKLEFAYAKFGAIGLGATFPASNMVLGQVLGVTGLVEKLAYKTRKILNIAMPSITVGQAANLTLFDNTTTWILNRKNIYSKSKNSPFIGQEFRGKVWAVINNGRSDLFHSL